MVKYIFIFLLNYIYIHILQMYITINQKYYKPQSIIQLMKNPKYKKITQKFAQIKDLKTKQVQENWKKQFQMDEHQKLAAQNIQLQYRNQKNTFNMQIDQNPQYEQDDENKDDRTKEQKQQEYYQSARQQKFIQFDGQKMYLGGLDIQLLKKQKELLKKEEQLNSINKKVTKFFEPKPSQIEMLKNVSKNKQFKTMVSNILNSQPQEKIKGKCLLNQNTYYEFETDYDFGSNVPKLTTKKLGKFHTNPIYTGITDQFISELTQILNKPKDVQNKKQADDKIILEDDSDDIFNEAPKVNIEVGKKLEFGLQQSIPQILQKRKREDIKTNQEQIHQFEKIQKKKKLLQQNNDGYMQCYWNTGPSLEQIQQMKRQGIVISYGEKRQFKQKEKKINYNKQYEKIQRVIAEQESRKKK